MKSIILLCAVMFAMVACGSKKDSDEVEVVSDEGTMAAILEEEVYEVTPRKVFFVEPFRVVKGPEVRNEAEVVFFDCEELSEREYIPFPSSDEDKIVVKMISSATAVGIVKKEVYREAKGKNLVPCYYKFYTTSKEFPVVEFERDKVVYTDLTQNNYKIIVDSNGMFAGMVVAE